MMKKKKKAKEGKCVCPYCEAELIVSYAPFCEPCGVVFRHCLRCGLTVLDKQATRCPKCAEPLT